MEPEPGTTSFFDAARQELLEYRSHKHVNQQAFLLNHGQEWRVFGGLFEQFNELGRVLSTAKTATGQTHVSLLPFLLLMQRQALVGFELSMACQCFGAWVLLRPALEAVLIVGKFVEDPRSVRIWQERATRPQEYSRAFSGKRLQSTKLPQASELQGVLRTINDLYVHANPEFYWRHTDLKRTGPSRLRIDVRYFDESEAVAASTLAFLHLVGTMQDSLAGLLQALFPTALLPRRIDELRGLLRPKVLPLLDREMAATTLRAIGLWPDDGDQSPATVNAVL